MKWSQDPRHKIRRKTIKSLFAASFTNQKVSILTQKVLNKAKQIDSEIAAAATAWPIEKINKIDLAILRLAVYELKIGNTPPKVIIDEAVELGKEYGSDNTPSFINGVLGNIFRKNEGKQTRK